MASTRTESDRQRTFEGEPQQARVPHTSAKPTVVQKKMSVGASDDRYEREADAVAAQVVQRISAGETAGNGAAGTTKGAPGKVARRTKATASPLGSIQRITGAPTVGLGGGDLDADTSERIERTRGGGSAMPEPLRRSMEGAFGGVDFAGVRLHSGAESKDLNQHLGAKAFTVGNDIYFNDGVPNASSQSDQSLLAHELTHTLQQGGTAQRRVQRLGTSPRTAPDLTGVTYGGLGEKTGAHENANNLGDGLKGGTGSIGEFDSANSFRKDMQTAHTGKDDGTTGLAGRDKAEQGNITIASGAMSTFDLVLDISKAIQIFTSNESSAMEKGGAVMGIASSTTKTAAGMSSITKTAQDSQAGSTTDVADKVLGEIAGFIGIFQGGYNMVKAIYELVSKGAQMTDREKAAGVGELVKAVLETGKGTVELINKFMSHLGTVAAPLLAAAPGIGIAMNCIELIMNGINIGFAYCAWVEMRDDKRTFKPPTGKTFWGGNKSFKATAQGTINKADEIERDHAEAKRALDAAALLVTGAGTSVSETAENLRKLKAEKVALEKSPKPMTKKDSERLKRLPALISAAERDATKAKDKKAEHERSHTTATSTMAERTAKNDELTNAREYMHSKNLQEIAAKRIQRGALNIGLTLPAIAGDIAILSGAGAAVGAGLKAASGGGKLLAVGVRMAKQAYHNSKGDDKSELSKLKLYDRLIKGMTKHVIDGAAKTGPAGVELRARALREITASGLSLATMEKYRTDGGELYKAWLKALKQR